MAKPSFRFASAEEKRAFTQRLFARLAPRYELVNVVMSLGQVNRWRRAAAAALQPAPGGWVLDVAAGTGGITRAVARRWPAARAVGIDFSRPMLDIARRNGQGLRWTEGDALRLPFADAVFDGVVNGFMLRNVTSVEATLAEQTRVVRPGGRVVCLEMSWPRNPLFRPFFRLYFAGLVPLLGYLLTGYRQAYQYLPYSVESFIDPDELAATMERVGLREVRYQPLMMGTVMLHVGVRGTEGP